MNGSQETARPGARPGTPGTVPAAAVPLGAAGCRPGHPSTARRKRSAPSASAVRPAARGRPGTGAGQGPERAVYRSPDAIRTARSTAAALLRHSVSSETGSESATTPAPACTYAVPSRSRAVRMAMAVSESPAKSR